MASSVFRLARLPSPPAPLPCVPGPKLAPFTPNAEADIEFVEFLGRENDLDSLVMRGTPFYFCHSDSLLGGQGGDLTRPLANSQLYADYFDPFNCECRAYGRLKEEKREDLAVKASGYLLLTPQQETDVARRVTGRRHEQHRELPVRAIVKELVARKAANPAQAPGMWADLQALHSLGIFVKDTHGGNYLGGKLVDFSRSWTMYHPAMEQIRASKLKDLMLDELQQLLDHYYFWANSSAEPIAIPQDLKSFCSGHIDRYKDFPRAYNWLKWEKNADAAKAYVEQRLFDKAAH
ncbi:kinetochore Sim4 complex subunit FTA2-domain-containing protein [Chaetomidium leptoderma]|uniref:Kinetochore Sim4 complex subunit FTA2-domain-containing protein n=1 Tax=Chaetomidium leptoderma TaxID=669021 RepID=A0AAN7A0Y2_9PEZI|nr:kinetochore Sim4 complex subunit FTA2-domain-containing protein [Chaetomidium leptoderma]